MTTTPLPVKYASISKNSPRVIFCEYEIEDGEFKEQVRRMLQEEEVLKLGRSRIVARSTTGDEEDDDDDDDDLGTRYTSNPDYEFHYILEKDLIFLIASRKASVSREEARRFLRGLSNAFINRIGMERSKGATRRFAFNAEFNPTLRRLVEQANASVNLLGEKNRSREGAEGSGRGEGDVESHGGGGGVAGSKAKALQRTLDYTTKTVRDNIGLALDRGAKLTQVASQSESMLDVSAQFRSNATALKNREFWNLQRTRFLFAAVVVVLLLLLYLITMRT